MQGVRILLKWWRNWWQSYEKKRLPDYVWNADTLTFWRERIILSLCFVNTVLCPFVLIPALFLCAHLGLWDIFVLDILTYVTGVFVLFSRRLALKTRVLIICTIFYILGTTLLLKSGPVGEGYLFLFGASLLGGSMIGLRAGIVSLWINCLIFFSLTLHIILIEPDWFVPDDRFILRWGVKTFSFLILNSIMTVATALMLREMESALSNEKEYGLVLSESEERYRLLADNVTDVIWTLNLDRTFTYVSPSALSLRGFTASETRNQSIEQILTPPSLKEAEALLEKEWRKILKCTFKTIVLEHEFTCRDGSTVWGESTISAIYGDDGGFKEILGVTRNIQDRRKTEEALRESEHKYRFLAENANDVIWTSDTRLMKTYISPSVEKLRGFTPEEALMLKPEEVLTEESMLRASTILIAELAKEERGEAISNHVIIDTEYYCKDGSTVWVENCVSPMRDISGSLSGMFGISRDITDRRRAEEELKKSEGRLRAIFEAAENVSFVITGANFPDITILEASSGTEKIFGYNRQEIIGSSLYSLHMNEDIAIVNKAYKNIAEGRDSLTEEMTLVRRSGEHFPAIISTYPLITGEGGIYSVLCVCIDISEQKKLEKRIIQSEKMAALGGLVAGLVHEISTPIGVALTSASFLRDKTERYSQQYAAGGHDVEQEKKYLRLADESSRMILANIDRTVEMVNSFKQVAVDQTSGAIRTFFLKSYLDEILMSLQPQIKNAICSINVSCPEDILLKSYPGAFYQIVSNFIVNSVIHGFQDNYDGAVEITVCSDGDEIIMSYRDNGNGVERDNIDKIFDPFFTTRRNRGGSGLGLHIVYNIVTQRLGGQISCESEPGAGVHFRINIPMVSIIAPVQSEYDEKKLIPIAG